VYNGKFGIFRQSRGKTKNIVELMIAVETGAKPAFLDTQ
jgi:hypothetical protein